MKKRFFSIAMLALFTGSVLFTSCIGPFNLTNKLLAWNQHIDNKYVNAIIFVVLSPAYGITLMADALVLNTIEFWTGENPVEAGIIKQVQGENGMYTVETLDNGYRITNEAGNEAKFVYDKQTNTWSLEENETTTKLITIKDEKSAIVYLPGGQQKEVALSSEGVLAFRQVMQNDACLALK